jgi:hypothetical protein
LLIQTQPQIQVKHDVPLEVKLEQVQKLLEQMGIRNVEPIAATAAQVRKMCVEVERRRAAEGYVRKVEEVMSFAGRRRTSCLRLRRDKASYVFQTPISL